MKSIILAGLILASLTQGAMSASCSMSTLRSLDRQVAKLATLEARCQKQVRSRRMSVDKMCSACGQYFVAMSKVERTISANKSCFKGTWSGRRVLRELPEVRQSIRFLRRGCGV